MDVTGHLVAIIVQNICVPKKSHKGLEQHEGVRIMKKIKNIWLSQADLSYNVIYI